MTLYETCSTDFCSVIFTLEEHVQYVCLVLQWLLENKLFVKVQKGVPWRIGPPHASANTCSTSWGSQIFIIASFATLVRWSPYLAASLIPSHFSLSEEAEAAFSKLKALFMSAPILSHLDPNHPSQVDASDVGVSTVLSQMSQTRSFIPAPFSVGICLQLRPIMTWDIGSRCQWCSHCRSGVIGWRDLQFHSWCGRTTKTLLT